MTTLALAVRTPRSRAIGIVIVAVALALASQIALPLPKTPVPLTLQPLVVVLAGLLIGPIDGAAAMVLYLVAGEVLLKLGEIERALTPGWFSVAPRGITRQLTKKGRNPAILLSITSGHVCDQSAAMSAQR